MAPHPDDRSADLSTLVASKDWADRVAAVDALQDRRDAEALALWRKLLRDSTDTGPIQRAVQVLMEQADDVAFDLLFEALADEPVEDEHLLWFIGGTPGLDRLLQAAASRVEGHENERVRRGAQQLIEWHRS